MSTGIRHSPPDATLNAQSTDRSHHVRPHAVPDRPDEGRGHRPRPQHRRADSRRRRRRSRRPRADLR
ncbi:hypothetical protein B4U78_009430 [Microbacterium esteraromaticum]|nr:hypothetical protein B4U78_009430 [Microbacterium esteraromaticum]